VGVAYAFTASETAWVFSTGLATFAIVMVLAGRILPKTGPRPLAIAGGLLLGSGFVAGGLFGDTFWVQLLCIGLISGAGIGLAYVVPIAVCVKWFPDKKGLITGLAVAGFGFGATIWVKLAGSWFGGLLNTSSVFGLPGVQSVFVIYGIVFFLLVLMGSAVMVNPPEGYQPAGWTPPDAGNGHEGGVEFRARDMLRTPQFYMLWSCFMFAGIASCSPVSQGSWLSTASSCSDWMLSSIAALPMVVPSRVRRWPGTRSSTALAALPGAAFRTGWAVNERLSSCPPCRV
jgi:MFS family permease